MKIKKIVLYGLGLLTPMAIGAIMLLVLIMGAVSDSEDSTCIVDSDGTASTHQTSTNSASASIEDFVKEHQEAYILSWKAGGFLPSASITQSYIENGFNFTNPNGTSFWQAHNMGGVKTSDLADFPITLKTYGKDSVDITGTKPGANVGDGTGGAYTWFYSYDAGIVGKAEFMAHQTLYTAAINNVNGASALAAIADGGWATDTSYKAKLLSTYESFGKQFKWLDELAIQKYGSSPYQAIQGNNDITSKIGNVNTASNGTTSNSASDWKVGTSSCSTSNTNSGGATDGTGDIPADATASGYKPQDVPTSLKPYIIDPETMGMKYASSDGWYKPGSDLLAGQCVNLTISLGNIIWGHQGNVSGDGRFQAAAWASIFGNSTQSKPIKGAIFSSGTSGAGHTGIVCHVFKDGTILVIQQNTPLSGWDFFGVPYTWDYALVSVQSQQADNFIYAYPTDRKPNLK